MNAKAENVAPNSGLDIVKLVVAALVFVASMFAYYWYADIWNDWTRVGVLVAGIVIALAIAAFTALGRSVREYLRESQFELRKVVWPTRDETVRTTLVVIVVVVILSLLLGFIDFLLKWLVVDTLMKIGH